MSDQGIRAAGILTARVSPAQGRSDLSFPGTVIIPQQQIRVIATPAGGIVEALMVGQDEPVRAGKGVAQVRSPTLVEAKRLYLAAISDDALASDKLRRARLLFEGKAAPERDLRIAESESAVNEAKLDERTQLLFLIGMDKTEFETLQSSRMIARRPDPAIAGERHRRYAPCRLRRADQGGSTAIHSRRPRSAPLQYLR